MQNIEMETEDTPFVIAARCHLPQGDGFLAAAGKFPAQLKGVPLVELPSECEAERFREGETLWKFVLPKPLASALA